MTIVWRSRSFTSFCPKNYWSQFFKLRKFLVQLFLWFLLISLKFFSFSAEWQLPLNGLYSTSAYSTSFSASPTFTWYAQLFTSPSLHITIIIITLFHCFYFLLLFIYVYLMFTFEPNFNFNCFSQYFRFLLKILINLID